MSSGAVTRGVTVALAPAVTLTRRRTVVFSVAALLAIAFLLLAVYLVRMELRLEREIVSAPWRNPIEIVSARTPNAEPLVRLYGNDWRVTQPLRLADLPPFVPQAFLAAEDVRFYRHPGIDPFGIVRAALRNLHGGGVEQGGSTITQQLIKQKLFSNARTFRRKIPEALLAIVLTARMSKADVLEGYLNDVYLGQWGGAPMLGVDEAARLYFDKAPGQLGPDEAAYIAGTIRAPNRLGANVGEDRVPDAAAMARRNSILATMHAQKWLTDEQYERALSRQTRIHAGALPDTPYGHYLSALRSELAALQASGAIRTLPAGGFRVVCEIDPLMQSAAEETARRGVSAMQRRYAWLRGRADLQTAILSVDPRNGGVRALVGSRDFRSDAYDRTRRMHRQPGSALKPFVYAAALESKRFTNASFVLDEPLQVSLGGSRTWAPHDYDERFRGPVAFRVALEQSLNVPTVRIAQSIGIKSVIAELQKFGFDEEFAEVPSLPLGVTEVTLRELVSAYCVMPAMGEQAPLHFIRELRDVKGKTLYRFAGESKRVCDPALAWMTHDLLRGVVLRGTAAKLRDFGLQHVAGKTGTTSDYRDAWFVGYTPDVVTGLWVGCDGGTPLRLSAGEAAVPLWGAYMQQFSTSTQPIEHPAGVVLRDIDPSSGLLWEEGCGGRVTESYLAGTEPTKRCGGEVDRHAPLLAGGNLEPGEISDETSRRWSREWDDERDDDTPVAVLRGDRGGVPSDESIDSPDDDEPAARSITPERHERRRTAHAHRRRHTRRHREGGLRGFLRRVF